MLVFFSFLKFLIHNCSNNATGEIEDKFGKIGRSNLVMNLNN
jgi:hypothetical protein